MTGHTGSLFFSWGFFFFLIFSWFTFINFVKGADSGRIVVLKGKNLFRKPKVGISGCRGKREEKREPKLNTFVSALTYHKSYENRGLIVFTLQVHPPTTTTLHCHPTPPPRYIPSPPTPPEQQQGPLPHHHHHHLLHPAACRWPLC